RAGVIQNLLARLDGFERGVLFRDVRWNALDLLGVEDRVYAVDEPRFLSIRGAATGRITASIGPGRLRFVGSLFNLPVLNLGALFASLHLPSVLCGLLVGHPPRVLVAALEAGGHQMNRV